MKVRPFLKDAKAEMVKNDFFEDWTELIRLKEEGVNVEGLGRKQEQCVQDSWSK